MIGRRALSLLLAAPAVAAAQAQSNYAWRVMRNGSAIGTHNVAFTARGEEVTALSETLVAPTVLGVVVYRFEHRYTEVTRGGRFVSVRSRLNRNGRIVEVEAEATSSAVVLKGPEGTLQLPPGAAPLSWWEPQRFGGAVPLFGTTTGRPLELGWVRQALPANGTRWRSSGEVEAVIEFDAARRWTAYQVRGDDGSLVTYERV